MPKPLGRILIVAVLAFATAAACSPVRVTETTAVQIARDFVVAGQPSEYEFLELNNEPPTVAGNAWRIKVDAHVRIPQDPPAESFLHFVIDVDRTTGTPSIYVQG